MRWGESQQSSQVFGKLALTVSCPGLLLLHIIKAGRQEELFRNQVEPMELLMERERVGKHSSLGCRGWEYGEHATTLIRGSSELCPHCGTIAQQHTDPEFLHLRNGVSDPATLAQCCGKEMGTEVIGQSLDGGSPTWMESLMKPHCQSLTRLGGSAVSTGKNPSAL